MSKAFFDKLHISAFMAAPSTGRRSGHHAPSDVKKAAALIVQSRRLYGRVKRLLCDGFFSFAVARQEIFIYFDFKESILLPNDFHLTYL